MAARNCGHCWSGLRNRKIVFAQLAMEDVKAGDVVAIWTAGAYGMSLASNYNARCRPAEVMVEGKRAKIIRRRESMKDLLRGDALRNFYASPHFNLLRRIS